MPPRAFGLRRPYARMSSTRCDCTPCNMHPSDQAHTLHSDFFRLDKQKDSSNKRPRQIHFGARKRQLLWHRGSAARQPNRLMGARSPASQEGFAARYLLMRSQGQSRKGDTLRRQYSCSSQGCRYTRRRLSTYSRRSMSYPGTSRKHLSWPLRAAGCRSQHGTRSAHLRCSSDQVHRHCTLAERRDLHADR